MYATKVTQQGNVQGALNMTATWRDDSSVEILDMERLDMERLQEEA